MTFKLRKQTESLYFALKKINDIIKEVNHSGTYFFLSIFCMYQLTVSYDGKFKQCMPKRMSCHFTLKFQ